MRCGRRIYQVLLSLFITVVNIKANASINSTNLMHRELQSSGNNVRAVCYEPMHNVEYPLNGSPLGDLRGAMDRDFAIMSKYFTTVRTYYSEYYGIPIAPIAAKYNVQLYLGIHDGPYYPQQLQAAIIAVRQYPNTIAALFIGNENLKFEWNSSPNVYDTINRMQDVRNQVRANTGRSVKVGTSQRITDWASNDNYVRGQMMAVAQASDIIGVSMYPFLDRSYNFNAPTQLLQALWQQMTSRYEFNKLCVSETGFPSAGASPSSAPNVLLNVQNSKQYYQALTTWQSGSVYPVFYFMFFDRRPEEGFQPPFENYFGFYNYRDEMKSESFPYLLGVSNQIPIGGDCSACGRGRGQNNCCVQGAYCQPWNIYYRQCKPKPPQCDRQYTDIDFYGNDIKAVYNIWPWECCSACRDTPGCVAYTFVNDPSRACYLKWSSGTPSIKYGAISSQIN